VGRGGSLYSAWLDYFEFSWPVERGGIVLGSNFFTILVFLARRGC
jgi:hypothetical protein